MRLYNWFCEPAENMNAIKFSKIKFSQRLILTSKEMCNCFVTWRLFFRIEDDIYLGPNGITNTRGHHDHIV